MLLLIDTYNVLHVVGVLPPEIAGLDASGLASMLIRSRWRNDECRLMCDGTPKGSPAPESERVRICYAGPGGSADDAIAECVAESSSPRRITVVSNDREVQREARRRRCRVMSAETFLTQLVEDREKSAKGIQNLEPPSQSVQEWVEEFELSDELDLKSAPPPPKPKPKPKPKEKKVERTNPKEAGSPKRSSTDDLDSIDKIDMNDLIDEEGNWRGPES